jgi:hypothetical protein
MKLFDRPVATCIFLHLFAFTHLAVSQISEPQLLAPEPSIDTFGAGENYTTTSDTKNDIYIRILDGGTLINGVEYKMYNNSTLDIQIGGSLKNDGQLSNRNLLQNAGTIDNQGEMGIFQGTLNNAVDGTINNHGFLSNIGTLNNDGTLNNYGSSEDIDRSGLYVGVGKILNNKGLVNNDSELVVNIGVFNNIIRSTLTNNTDATLNIRGIMTNQGLVTNDGLLKTGTGNTVFNQRGGILNNNASITNYGSLQNYKATINNASGSTTYNKGLLSNTAGGTINNASGSTIDNEGTMSNRGFSGYLEDGTYVERESLFTNNGTINNSYLLQNQRLGIFQNNGTINSTISQSGAISSIQNQGTLVNNGTINGNVDVKAGGILTGSGTIVGSVLLEGAINPGNSPGTITTSNQTWINGASYGWEINDSEGTAGGAVGWDLIDITATEIENGSLDLSQLTTGGFGIDVISLDALNDLGLAEGFDDPNGAYEFVILTAIGGITGFEADVFTINDDGFNNSDSLNWSINQDGNNLVLKATGYTLVPEPSSSSILGVSVFIMLLRRKRS